VKKQKLSPVFSRACVMGLAVIATISTVHAEDAGNALSGPGSTVSVLTEDAKDANDVLGIDVQKSWADRKAKIKENTGLDFGIDYNVLGYAATSSAGRDSSASGSARVFGQWELLGRDGPNSGSLVFKIEHRHRLDSVAPVDFSSEIGYAGLVSSVFSNQGWRATHLYWQQNFAGGRGVFYVGWLDSTDYTDVYALASPWTGFSNLAFQTGSGSIGGLPDGSLGAMLGGFLNDNIYAATSIVDANGDATKPFDGFSSLFGDGETFKTLEIGRTSGADALFVNNAHLTFWQIDEREDAGTPDGYGVAFSYTQAVGDSFLLFIRGGWAEGGGSLYDKALSVGFGYSKDPSRDLLSVGLNWSRPNESTFGTDLDDQYTLEVFQQWQVTENISITPSLQLIKDPAFNPDKDTIALFGLRLRAAF
jgi:porin